MIYVLLHYFLFYGTEPGDQKIGLLVLGQFIPFR